MITKNHHFFLLPPRPWPLLTTIISFNFIFSIILIFKFNNTQCFLIRIILIFISRFFWWIFFRNEINLEGNSSLSFETGVKFAIILFISSEVFFFFSFFWSYFHYFLSPTLEIGAIWPPTKIIMFEFLNVPLINTLVLLSSGFTVTMRHYFLIVNKRKLSILFLFLTIFLGLIFSLLQLLEYRSSFFSISDGRFGTAFFVLTGFHGIHVLIGSIFLLTSIIRSIKISRTWSNFLRFELASWYWHFVDVVWIFLYFFLYYINN